MLKKLAIALALVIPTTASADTRTYDVRHDSGAFVNSETCGAFARLNRERHVMKFDDDTGRLTIDGFDWTLWQDWLPHDSDFRAEFHHYVHGAEQNTWLLVDIYVDDRGLIGKYVLFGKTLKGKPCVDITYITGVRR
jgi:hypothetical protein